MTDEEQLVHALEALGLRYELRQEAGRPVAGFQYQLAPGTLVPFDAQVRSGVLQLRARAGRGGLELRPRINELNKRWWLGRVYLDQDHRLATSAGLVLAHTTSPIEALRTLLALLRRAVWFLLNAPASFARIDDDTHSPTDTSFEDSFSALLVDEAEQVPAVAGAPLDELAALLARSGRPFSMRADGVTLTQRFTVEGERDFVVDLFVVRSALLCMRARRLGTTLVVDPVAALHGLERLNQRFAIGNAVLDGARTLVQIALPLRWTRLDADLADWLLARAHAAMAAVDRAVELRD